MRTRTVRHPSALSGALRPVEIRSVTASDMRGRPARVPTMPIIGTIANGVAAAAIIVAVREFAPASLIPVGAMTVTGTAFGFILRAAHRWAAAILIASIGFLGAFGIVLSVVDGSANAIVVSGLGLVFLSAAEGTRRVLLLDSKGGLK